MANYDYVGAELYGDLAGEMINVVTTIINGRMTMEMMMGTIWAFPTQTDGLTEMLAPCSTLTCLRCKSNTCRKRTDISIGP